MADAAKAQKLAAARKKLKEFQQKTQKPTKTSTENDDNMILNEALSSSTHSSINDSVHLDSAFVPQSYTVPPLQPSPFQNYFQENVQNDFIQQEQQQQQSSNFFDTISSLHQSSEPVNNTNNFNMFNDVKYDNHNEREDSKLTVIYNENLPAKSEVNNLSNYFDKIENVDHPSVSSEDAKKLVEYMGGSIHNDADNSMNSIQIINGDHRHTDQIEIKPSVENSLFTPNPTNSNTESLRQLSSQISDLLKDDVISAPIQTNELEKRNQELASLLQQEQIQVQKAHAQLQDYQNRIAQLESESRQTRVDYEHKLNRELGPLQEQLQCHAQTVGILVGEKTELSTALSQNQILIKQKVIECEELQGRLKTSRSRVADLEKELQSLKLEKIKFEQTESSEEEINKLKRENRELFEQKEEATQDLLELREKLNIKANENLALQREIQEISHQFSLAQVKIEQITAGESLQAESQVEVLTQQKLILEKQVSELSQALKATSEERDQASAQYQHYVQQLNSQLSSLANKLETLTNENVILSNREQELVRHIGELEKHLQNVQQERLNSVASKDITASSEVEKELQSTLQSVQNLRSQNDELEEKYKQILKEKEELQFELETKKDLMEQLEGELEKVQSEQPDSGKLLAAMESDKVAAARAVTQNAELKQQLEEMQQAFVRMSNDKLELADKLSSEQHHIRELAEKLENTENQLHTLSDAIKIKDNELTHMRETLTHQNKQILQKDQLADRLRHYEAQDGSSQSLQVELQKAQEYIRQLVTENRKLKEGLVNQAMTLNKDSIVEHKPVQEQESVNGTETKSEIVEVEEHAIEKYDKVDGSEKVSNNSTDDINILDKEEAMKHLEAKFTRTMQDIANLTEEKLRLEHIVTQLQGETETIGEYIALYQHQRGILKQRTQEKDKQLKQLAEDREKVKTKLDLLNGLVKKLVQEKGILTSEILEQHEKLNSQSHELCTEHAKIHQEINKITNQHVPSLENNEQSYTHENNNVNTETAEQIIALLSEIKSSSLIQPSDDSEHIHSCPWCSGQLLTV